MQLEEEKVIREARDWLMGSTTSSDKHCIARMLTGLLGEEELAKFDKATADAIEQETKTIERHILDALIKEQNEGASGGRL